MSGWGTTSRSAGADGSGGAIASRLQYGRLRYVPGNCAADVGVSRSAVTPDMIW